MSASTLDMVAPAPRFTAEARFPRIKWSPEAIAIYVKACAFCAAHPDADVGDAMRAELDQRLDYLNGYGYGKDTGIARFRVELQSDWAPHSWSVAWFHIKADGTFEYAWNGGLICHCSGSDPLSISLSSCFWGIHT